LLSNRGPSNDPVPRNTWPGAIGALAGGDAAMPVGIAYPHGLVEHRKGPATTFGSVVSQTELPGRWLC
jgi:hypothetical protein